MNGTKTKTIEERIAVLEKAGQLEERVTKTEARVDALEEWQVRQNGSLQRIEDKLDSLYSRIMWGFLAGGIGLIVDILVHVMGLK